MTDTRTKARMIRSLTYLRLGLLFVDEAYTRITWNGVQYRAYRKQYFREIYRERRRLYNVLAQLKKQGFIETDTEAKGVVLTEKGRRTIRELAVQLEEPPRRRPWDGKWHLVIFDVPESHRIGRDLLRRKLTDYGCVQLQKSVFIYPYSLRRMIERLREAYDLRSDVHYLVVESFDSADSIEERFRKYGVLP